MVGLLPAVLTACQAGHPAIADSTGPIDAQRWSAAGLYLAGEHAVNAGDMKTAADLLPLALEADPGNANLAQLALVALVSDGRFEPAVSLAKQTVEADPKAPLAGMVLAIDAVKRDKPEEAHKLLNAMGEDAVGRIAQPLIVAWLILEEQGLDKAEAAMKPIQAVDGLKPLVEAHLAMMEEMTGKDDAAGKRFAGLADNEHLTSHILELYVDLLHRQGRDGDAKKVIDKFRGLTNDVSNSMADVLEGRLAQPAPKAPLVDTPAKGVAEVLFDIGSLLRSDKLNGQAVLFSRMALYLNPKLDIAKLLVGNLLQDGNHLESAVDIYRTVMPDSPYRWSAQLAIADCLRDLDKTADALKQLQDLVKADPKRTEAAIALGDLLRREKRYQEAADAYSTAIERIGMPRPDDWSVFYFRGTAYERNNQWDKAEPDFQKALALSPDQPYVLNYLAYTWVEKREHLDEALKMLEKAVQQRPEEGFIVDSLGWAYYQLGNYDKAVGYLERAVELQPEDPVLNDHLGDAYWRVGRKAEAKFQWSRALNFKPEADQVGLIEGKIKNGLQAAPAAAKTQQDG
ncbi:MAG TPA: tetratricopeptide repeat protein [Dongiaceae bacterium]|jgi:tetratricopeptide (TPR) repeat protein|nr:tetratricopeptide repeat protein [Dongiaceae bacterium]